jgi:hypothetical protein
MKFKSILTLLGIVASLSVGTSIASAASGSADTANASAIVTVEPRSHQHATALVPGDLLVYTGKTSAHVTSVEPLNENARTELFIYLDESSRQGALSPHIKELKTFINSLPSNVRVAVGYMRNGGFSLNQAFTSDHDLAAKAVRIPEAVPGINGSPYFALSYLVKHWPSNEQVDRRAVLMLTDGVDRYYADNSSQDPYVDAAVKDAQHYGIVVSSIYLKGAGLYGEGGFSQVMSQSRLMDVAKGTGGEAYFEGLETPVSLTPYLNQFAQRLNRQYRVAFVARPVSGLQPVTFRSEIAGVKVAGPTAVLVKGDRS